MLPFPPILPTHFYFYYILFHFFVTLEAVASKAWYGVKKKINSESNAANGGGRGGAGWRREFIRDIQRN